MRATLKRSKRPKLSEETAAVAFHRTGGHGKAPMTQDERSKMETAWADRRCDTVQRDGFVDGWTAAYAEVADLKRRLLNAEYALEHDQSNEIERLMGVADTRFCELNAVKAELAALRRTLGRLA